MTKSSDYNSEVDEISSAVQAQLLLYSIPEPSSASSEKPDKTKSKKKVEKKKEVKSKIAPSVKKEETKTSFDRWSLAPTESIEYGYLSASPSINKSTDSQSPKYYLTTAINYTNGPAHMGHAYEATTADCLSRFARLQYGSENAYFVTGADEHGQKIANTAEADGKQPIEICDKYVTGFQCLNQRILITNNDYVRTTSSRHKRTAQALWKKCAANDDIYLSKYSGWYNIREETFVTDSDAALSDYKDPTSGLPLKKVEEESYFFRMASYHDRLVNHIETNPEFIQPASHRNAILARLNGDKLRDLSISRTTFNWGIPVPEGFEQNHVMYVWFDALSNYLTGINGLGVNHEDADNNTADKSLKSFWPADVHIIGKDILWFHTVIWPCILFSAGIPLPKTVFAHGFVNDKEGKKMSKSMGNVVDPHDMLDKYSVDTFRWYLCKEAPYGGELSFSEDSLMDMHNSDLADTLGNLVHRATNLCGKYCGGVVPDLSTTETAVADFNAYRTEYMAKMNAFELENGASIAMKAFREVNGFLTDKAPWHIKGKDEESVKARQLVVRAVLEAVYALAHLLMPFLPNGSKAIFTKLNTKPKNTLAEVDGSLMNLSVGTKIDVGDILYSKIISEDEKNTAEASKKKAEAYAEAQKRKKEKKQKEIAASKAGQKSSKSDSADQPDFTKMEIRVGQITKVWYHTEADKLFCEEIDVGEENKRQIASGLREHYTLEQMDGRKVLVVCNLKAAKIVGFASNGMVLAAKSDDGTKVELIDPPSDAAIGEQVYIEGLTGFDPCSSAQVKKKKIWDVVAKKLRTGDKGVAQWDGKDILTSKGACSAASLVGAPIS